MGQDGQGPDLSILYCSESKADRGALPRSTSAPQYPFPSSRSLCYLQLTSEPLPMPCSSLKGAISQCLLQGSGELHTLTNGWEDKGPNHLFLSRGDSIESCGPWIHYSSNRPLPNETPAQLAIVSRTFSIKHPILKSHLKVCLLEEQT